MDITSKCLCVCATWCFAPLSVKVSSIYSRQFKPVPVHNSLDDLGVVLLATLHSSVLPLHQAALTVSGPNLKKKDCIWIGWSGKFITQKIEKTELQMGVEINIINNTCMALQHIPDMP